MKNKIFNNQSFIKMNHRPFYPEVVTVEVATVEAAVILTLEIVGQVLLVLLTLHLNHAFEKLFGIRYMVMVIRPTPEFEMQ